MRHSLKYRRLDSALLRARALPCSKLVVSFGGHRPQLHLHPGMSKLPASTSTLLKTSRMCLWPRSPDSARATPSILRHRALLAHLGNLFRRLSVAALRASMAQRWRTRSTLLIPKGYSGAAVARREDANVRLICVSFQICAVLQGSTL